MEKWKDRELAATESKADMDVVLLDEQSSMSSLSNSVQAMLDSDSSTAKLFTAECKTAARKLIASLFYFELGCK